MELYEAIEMLQKHKEEYEGTWARLYLDKDYGDDRSWYNLMGEREETDKEAQDRYDQNEQYRKTQEEREWKEYIRLKEKLGPRILKENLDKIVNE
jgi:hypothetical protein